MIKIPVFDTGYEIWSTPQGFSYGKPYETVQRIKGKPDKATVILQKAKHYGFANTALMLTNLAHELLNQLSDGNITTIRQYIDELYQWEKRIGELVNGPGAVSQSVSQSTDRAVKRMDGLISARRIACVSVAEG